MLQHYSVIWNEVKLAINIIKVVKLKWNRMAYMYLVHNYQNVIKHISILQ